MKMGQRLLVFALKASKRFAEAFLSLRHGQAPNMQS
ncbi:hypothetical protein GGQ59_001638 [Parvularcula dongshanensis]|uniref:Uncharacterized protein n=1 Tax=Parvularcula dongshanensis TaxID=1173995 RepID=A0A840I4C3_9PROT|nr:hypothetical protein [Parvularcula dongshanensis]